MNSRQTINASVLATALLVSGWASAHNGMDHDEGVSVDTASQSQSSFNANAIPPDIAGIGGPFALTDHDDNPVSNRSYAGEHMLVFFGYTNCKVMCSISLKRIGDALGILQSDASVELDKLTPLVITVDPENDTPQRLKSALAQYHSKLTGLTGTLEQLRPVYKAYGQTPETLDVQLGESAVVQHSSYFFLMGPDGKLQTLFPPVLNAASMAAILKKYLQG